MNLFRSKRLKDRLATLGREETMIANYLDGLDDNDIVDLELAIRLGERSYENTIELSKIHLEMRQYDLYKIALMNQTKINDALMILKQKHHNMVLCH